MKKEGNKFNYLFWVMFVVPFFVGTIGFMKNGYSVVDAAFYTVTMYVLNYGDSPVNSLTEIARWTAPIMTASGIVQAVSTVFYMMRQRLKGKMRDSAVVYGSGEDAEKLLTRLGNHGIRGREKFIAAKKAVFLQPEEKSIEFYIEHRKKFAEMQVFMNCETLRAEPVDQPNLTLFSMEELAARLYWKRAGIFEQYQKSEKPFRIVLIGFERLGEELLYWGLQNNLFSPDQKIEYHIYGDGRRFSLLHRNLNQITDRVIFHNETWQESAKEIEEANRIIVCSQQDQIRIVQDMLFLLNKEFDVIPFDDRICSIVSTRSRCHLYMLRDEILSPKYIFDEAAIAQAKALNLSYDVLHNGVQPTPENREKQWKACTGFVRASNISAADYHEIRLQMLKGWNKDKDTLTPEQLDLLSELEHIRWCRFHWLNNWSYGKPENGKNKDPELRIHRDLLPYQELPESEREKDRNNIFELLATDLNI